jgi:hypothetical protein
MVHDAGLVDHARIVHTLERLRELPSDVPDLYHRNWKSLF